MRRGSPTRICFRFLASPRRFPTIALQTFHQPQFGVNLALTSPHSCAIGTKVKGVYSCFLKWLLLPRGSPTSICFRFLASPRRFPTIALQTFHQPQFGVNLALMSPHSCAIGTKVKEVYSCFLKWLLLPRGSPTRICFRFLASPRRFFTIELQTFYQPRPRASVALTSPHSCVIGTKVKGVYSCFLKWLLLPRGRPTRICFRFLASPRRFFYN